MRIESPNPDHQLMAYPVAGAMMNCYFCRNVNVKYKRECGDRLCARTEIKEIVDHKSTPNKSQEKRVSSPKTEGRCLTCLRLELAKKYNC